MTIWDDRFEQHPLHESLEKLKALLQDIDMADVNEDVAVRISKLQRVSAFVLKSVDNVDPILVTPTMMNEVGNATASVVQHVENYRAQESAGYLDNAVTYADQLLDAISRWPSMADDLDQEGLREHITSFRRSSSQLLSNFRGEVSDALGELQGLRNEIEQQQSSIRNQIQDAQAAAQDVQTHTGALKAQVETVVTDLEQRLERQEEQHREDVQRLVDQAKSDFSKRLDEFADASATQREELREKSEGTIKALKQKELEASRLVSVIGREGAIGGFREYAVQQKKDADRWRWFAVGSLAGLVILALVSLLFPDLRIHSGPVTTKVVLSSALGLLAAFSAREAADHRRQEKVARRYEVELAAVDSYLELHPEKENLKAELARKYFGNIRGEEPGYEGVSPTSIREALRQMLADANRDAER